MKKTKSSTPREKREKPAHYCKNADLLREVIKYKETGTVSNELGQYFLAIAWHLTGHSNFRQYSYGLKEEFVGLGVMKMVKGLDSFKPEKSSNAFAYFTQICWNAFIYSCKDYYKQINIKKQIFENYLINAQSTHAIDPNGLAQTYLEDLLDANKAADEERERRKQEEQNEEN